MNRRHFLKTSLGTLASVTLLPGFAQARFQPQGWVTGFADQSGGYGAAFIAPDLSVTKILASPQRLHRVFVSPDGQDIVAPARRPGNILAVLREGGDDLAIQSPEDRHYFGHAAFSLDGRRLYVPENDFDGERGVVGVYDVGSQYKRIAEWPSNGVGPHELRVMPDGKHVIIANGGILTHPETGRVKLNLDTMQPNLTLMSADDGTIIDTAALSEDFHQLSIRHFDVTPKGDVVFGVQDQKQPYTVRPMVGAWTPGHAPRMFEVPKGGWQVLSGYVGSVVTDRSGRLAAAASPRGNIVVFWDVASGHVLGEWCAQDVCGLAATVADEEFLITTGQGQLATLGLRDDGIVGIQEQQHVLRFDNHCCAKA